MPTFLTLCTFRRCIRFYPFDIIYTTCVPNGLVCNYSDISQWTRNLKQSSVRHLRGVFGIFNFFFFFCQGFLSRTLTTHRAIGEGRGPSLSHSITSTRSRTFRHLFSTLHVRWISYISNCTACILPPYRITIWLVDDVMLIFVCLLVDLIQGFCYSYLTLETGGPVHLLRLTFRELIHPD